MTHNRRPGNNNNIDLDGIQIPPYQDTGGYHSLRTSSEIKQNPQHIGEEPYQLLNNEKGRNYNRCRVFIAIVIVITLIAVGCVITGLIVHHRTRIHVETKQCGDQQIPADADCVDIIVVGCGNAGLAAANEISSDPSLSVLCLEEGPDYAAWDATILDFMTGGFFNYFGLVAQYPNKYFYQVAGATEPGLSGKQHTFLGGRTFGGSASLDIMLPFRASDAYWNNFDVAAGSPGTFTAASMHAMFEEMEWLNDHGHYASKPTRGDGSSSGQTWKIDVLPHNDIAGYDQERIATLLSAALGLPVYSDQSYNNPGYTFGVFPYIEWNWDFETSNPELRWTSRASFAGPEIMDQQTYVGKAPRRFVAKLNSTVLKLLHAPSTSPPVFTGVQHKRRDGVVQNTYATKEIIVSAGMNTAPLLLRSGVGPSSVLSASQIAPVVVNNNIGQKMYVHLGVDAFVLWSNITAVDPDGTNFPTFCTALVEDTTLAGVPGQRGYKYDSIGLAPGLMIFGISKLHVVSFGSSEIYGDDPLQLQKMITNALTNPNDLMSFRKAIRDLLWGITGVDSTIFLLNIDNATLANDALLDTWLSSHVFPLNHYLMTSNMGTDPATSVVDNKFRVWNTQRLRVCDAQAYATLIDAHPSYSTALLGRICGKLVLDEHGSESVKRSYPLHRKHLQDDAKRRRTSNTSTQRRNIVAPTRAYKRDDASLWANYQNAITQIKEKFPGIRGQGIINAIKETSEYVRLCILYCHQ